MKSLGQFAYEVSPKGGQQNFGPWEKAPEVVRRVHEEMARVVEREVLKRLPSEIIVACYDCGLPYREMGLDLILPDQQWKYLFPEESGLLCANCICQRATRHRGTAWLCWIDNFMVEREEP